MAEQHCQEQQHNQQSNIEGGNLPLMQMLPSAWCRCDQHC